jgi:hypothetical protein
MMVFDEANAHTFGQAFRSSPTPGFLLTKAVGRLGSRAPLRSRSVALPAGVILGHLHRGSNRDRLVDRRPCPRASC